MDELCGRSEAAQSHLSRPHHQLHHCLPTVVRGNRRRSKERGREREGRATRPHNWRKAADTSTTKCRNVKLKGYKCECPLLVSLLLHFSSFLQEIQPSAQFVFVCFYTRTSQISSYKSCFKVRVSEPKLERSDWLLDWPGFRPFTSIIEPPQE